TQEPPVEKHPVPRPPVATPPVVGSAAADPGGSGRSGTASTGYNVPAPSGPGEPGVPSAGHDVPAPGTFSLRVIVRQSETREELPAGTFEVRLVSLDLESEGSNHDTDVGVRPPISSGDVSAASSPRAGGGGASGSGALRNGALPHAGGSDPG